MDGVRLDGKDQACFGASAGPGEWLPEVALGEFVDVSGGAVGGNARDFAARRLPIQCGACTVAWVAWR
jgi:hypothetical protein